MLYYFLLLQLLPCKPKWVSSYHTISFLSDSPQQNSKERSDFVCLTSYPIRMQSPFSWSSVPLAHWHTARITTELYPSQMLDFGSHDAVAQWFCKRQTDHVTCCPKVQFQWLPVTFPSQEKNKEHFMAGGNTRRSPAHPSLSLLLSQCSFSYCPPGVLVTLLIQAMLAHASGFSN